MKARRVDHVLAALTCPRLTGRHSSALAIGTAHLRAGSPGRASARYRPLASIVDSVGPEYTETMKTMQYVYWQHDDMWLGYLQEFPDYWTQGETLDELQENLKDLYQELTSGNIPEVRRVAELQVS